MLLGWFYIWDNNLPTLIPWHSFQSKLEKPLIFCSYNISFSPKSTHIFFKPNIEIQTVLFSDKFVKVSLEFKQVYYFFRLNYGYTKVQVAARYAKLTVGWPIAQLLLSRSHNPSETWQRKIRRIALQEGSFLNSVNVSHNSQLASKKLSPN